MDMQTSLWPARGGQVHGGYQPHPFHLRGLSGNGQTEDHNPTNCAGRLPKQPQCCADVRHGCDVDLSKIRGSGAWCAKTSH